MSIYVPGQSIEGENLARLLAADPKTLSDEERVLRSLRKPAVFGKEAEARNAPFKIEVHWGKDRTLHGQCTGAILCWESGRRLNGQADSLLFWCGYPDCRKPIRAGTVEAVRAVCTSCSRDNVMSPEAREACASARGLSSDAARQIRALPIAVGHVFFKMSMRGVANTVADYWRRLGGQADVYMKYSRIDPRVQNSDKSNTAVVADLKKAADHDRYRKQGILVYPLYRIQRDIAAGSTPEARFLAMCTA